MCGEAPETSQNSPKEETDFLRGGSHASSLGERPECMLYHEGLKVGDTLMLSPFSFFWLCARTSGDLPSLYVVCITHAAGVAAAVCGLQIFQPEIYNRWRKSLLATMWLIGTFAMLQMTAVAGHSLKHRPSGMTAFVGMMMLKWMFLVSFFYWSGTKLSSVLYLQLPCLSIMNYAAYDAAIRLQTCVTTTTWVRFLTWGLNRMLDVPWLWVSRQLAWMCKNPSLAATPLARPLLTRTQCLLLAWLMLQSSVFWIGFAFLATKELHAAAKTGKLTRQSSIPTQRVKVLVAQACSVQVGLHCIFVMAARQKSTQE